MQTLGCNNKNWLNLTAESWSSTLEVVFVSHTGNRISWKISQATWSGLQLLLGFRLACLMFRWCQRPWFRTCCLGQKRPWHCNVNKYHSGCACLKLVFCNFWQSMAVKFSRFYGTASTTISDRRAKTICLFFPDTWHLTHSIMTAGEA